MNDLPRKPWNGTPPRSSAHPAPKVNGTAHLKPNGASQIRPNGAPRMKPNGAPRPEFNSPPPHQTGGPAQARPQSNGAMPRGLNGAVPPQAKGAGSSAMPPGKRLDISSRRPPELDGAPALQEELTPASLARRFSPEPRQIVPEPQWDADESWPEPESSRRRGLSRQMFKARAPRLRGLPLSRKALAGIAAAVLLPILGIIGLIAFRSAEPAGTVAQTSAAVSAAPQARPPAVTQTASTSAAPPQVQAAPPKSQGKIQDTPPPVTPVLSSVPMLQVGPGRPAPFAIAIDGTDGVPPRSAVAISGLPAGVSLSAGRPFGEGQWSLRTDEIGDVTITAPASAQGSHNLTLQLVTATGSVLAESKTDLVVTAPPQTMASTPQTPTFQGAAAPAPTPASNKASPGVAPGGVASDGMPMPEPKPAPSKQSAPPKTAAAAQAQPAPAVSGGEAMVANTDVNMRQQPSSKAPAVAVLHKGAHVRAAATKYGWVQVTDQKQQTGWVYQRFLTAAAN